MPDVSRDLTRRFLLHALSALPLPVLEKDPPGAGIGRVRRRNAGSAGDEHNRDVREVGYFPAQPEQLIGIDCRSPPHVEAGDDP